MKSPLSPLNFACSSEDEELAKAFDRICIMTRPGATKVPKGTPKTTRLPPTATTKTSM